MNGKRYVYVHINEGKAFLSRKAMLQNLLVESDCVRLELVPYNRNQPVDVVGQKK